MFMRDDHIIEYRFYEKKMNSPYCVMAKSAMSESAKISAMSQEVVRRMCNTSDIVDQEMRDDIVDAFSAKLTRSGYSKQQVRTVIESGLKGYQNKLARCAKKGKMLHRPATSTAASRNRKKLLGKTNWFFLSYLYYAKQPFTSFQSHKVIKSPPVLTKFYQCQNQMKNINSC